MAKIVHLALKVDEIERTGDFYQDVFGFQDAETKKTRDHTVAPHDRRRDRFHAAASTTPARSRRNRRQPATARASITSRSKSRTWPRPPRRSSRAAATIVSDPGVIPVKFRAPGGTVAELVPIGRYKQVASDRKIDRIVHLALKVDEIEKTGDFYKEVFGFRDSETKKTRDHLSRHMTDGAIDFTLLKYDAGTESAESKAAGEGPCIHHFAVEVADLEKATAADQVLRVEDRQRSRRDPGEIPRSRRHDRRTRSAGPLQALSRWLTAER